MGKSEQSVVVGYDGSSVAGGAVTWAASEAARRDEPLVVLVATNHVRRAADLLSLSGVQGGTWEEESERLASAGADIARTVGSPIQVQTRVSGKGAVAALCEAAEETDVVVVGSTGRGRVLHSSLGSVAFAVMTHATVSVVSVPSEHPTAAGPDHPIVVGVDGSTGSDHAVDQAAEMAFDAGAELLVVSAWQAPRDDYLNDIYLAGKEWHTSEIDRIRDGARKLATMTRARVKEAHPDLIVREVVQEGRPEEVIVGAHEDAALIVVGARGRGDFASLLLGSVSRAVVHAAHCPVAIIR